MSLLHCSRMDNVARHHRWQVCSQAQSLPPASRMLVPVSYYTRVWELFGHQSGPVLATVLSRRGLALS